MATQRQKEVWQLHKECCIANGHPQSQIRHRQKEGTLTSVGPQGLNTLYDEPAPRATDNPTDAAQYVWATWEGLHLRGINQDSGDSTSSRMWLQRMLVQFPYIDDSFNPVVVQDDDFLYNPDGIKFKIENVTLSADGAWWTAICMIYR